MKNVKIDHLGLGSRRVLEEKSQKSHKSTRVSTGGAPMASQSHPQTIEEDRRESNASLDIEMDDLDGIISAQDQTSQAITGPSDIQSNLLEGLTFVVSGTFENISRNALEDFIE